jgi:thiamine pyrophosphate-dependent acetolactate synthase large subunit-like protein
MARKPSRGGARGGVGRRGFLVGAAVAGAATGLPTPSRAAPAAGAPPGIRPPTSRLVAAETASPAAADHAETLHIGRSGSDHMVDAIKALGIEYVASMPGSSFRGLHESLINYGGNQKPEFLTCLHEESSIGMAHGYAKATGKPMLVLVHGTVGLQHASMAIYNAWCDRVPIVVIGGNTLDAAMRRPGVEWIHTVQDAAIMVRDYTKWDDQPLSLAHFDESLMRAYRIALTPPMGPVLLMADSELQERPIEGVEPGLPRRSPIALPQGDTGAVKEAAALLATAENPVILADRLARTPQGMALLIELAEALSAPVIDKQGRMNFPTDHWLNHSDRASSLIREADVVIGFEMTDFYGAVNQYRDVVHRNAKPATKPDAKLISVGVGDLFTKSNFQDFERYQGVDVAIAGDGEATLPALIEAVKRALPAERKAALEARAAKLQASFKTMVAKNRQEASYGWDVSPISTARLCAELWAQIKSHDWALVSETQFQSSWPQRLWAINKHYQFNGGSGGYGVGYTAPASVGAALAHREHGRLAVSLQGDGDLMCAPGVLWTAAHHKIPLISVIHNNRSYHQEMMHVQRMALRHDRGVDRIHIGTAIDGPDIDFTKLAQSFGVWGSGPITEPGDLAPAITKAIQVAQAGEPAVIDVVSQPR